MRPRTLDEYIGQEHIIGKGKLLRRAIQADRLSSLIFFGPPGTGKTTLAQVIANHTKSNFLSLNAVLAGVPQIRDCIATAEKYKTIYGKTTILFIDEVHRWNKTQQDALLPWVENGTVIFIGATTENPFFEVNKALVSRSRIFQLYALTAKDLQQAATRTLQDRERGYGQWHVAFTEGALEHLIETAAGDARSFLNALELAVETSVEHWPPPAGSTITIDRTIAEESIQQKVVLYDKDGDYHYDVMSAFIKSIRGSDPDAALYWLARMVSAGESPHAIFRRLLISACEDVGLADPQALGVVTSAAQAFDRVGLPEGQYHLAHAVLYLATCPKSNSTLAFFDALKAVEKANAEVPNHLKDANRDAKDLGHGAGYLYPHAYKEHWVAQQYLPDALLGAAFYTPSTIGYEANIRNEVLSKRETQRAALIDSAASIPTSGYAYEDWQSRTEGTNAYTLETIRDSILQKAQLKKSDRVLVYRADDSLLLWHIARIIETGCTAGLYEKERTFTEAQQYAAQYDELQRPFIAHITHAKQHSDTPLFPDLSFDVVVAYNPAQTLAGFAHFFERIQREHTDTARIIIAFPLPQKGLRLAAMLKDTHLDTTVQEQFYRAETAFFSNNEHERFAWTERSVCELAKTYAYALKTVQKQDYAEKRFITQKEIDQWFSEKSEYGVSIRRLLGEHAPAVHGIIDALKIICQKPVSFSRTIVYTELTSAMQ
ncbi:MAG: AAA family ATPase [Treponema sp.]